MAKKWQTTIYLPTEYKEGVKSNKLDLSGIVTEQLDYILGGRSTPEIMSPTLNKRRAMDVIRATVPQIIAEKYDDSRLIRWLPEADRHGDYIERLSEYVKDVQNSAEMDGYSSEIIIFTSNYLARMDTPT